MFSSGASARTGIYRNGSSCACFSWYDAPICFTRVRCLRQILFSAWITELIGVHAIFGAFIVGVSIPRIRGFSVTLTEKIEDLVTIVLLPLVCALLRACDSQELVFCVQWIAHEFVAVGHCLCVGHSGDCFFVGLCGQNWRMHDFLKGFSRMLDGA